MTTDTMKALEKISGGPLTLGKAIKTIRLSENKKQGEFAKLLNVTQSYLSDLENDRKEVSPQKAVQIAELLGHSKKQFIRLALQDALSRQGLYYAIDVHDAA